MGLFSSLLGGGHAPPNDDLLRQVEWAVDRIDPMLKRLDNYPGRYLKPVAHALEHARTLADRVPGPLSVTPESHAANPVVRVLFPRPEQAYGAFEASLEIRDFLSGHPGISEIYALACMRRNVKDVLGMEVRGDVLRRDVPQQVLFFTDYMLMAPGLTEAESRQNMARHFFENLVDQVANRIKERRAMHEKIEAERDEWTSRLRVAGPDQRGEMQKKLNGVIRRLSASVRGLELRRHYRDFEAVLLHPEWHLHLEQVELTLDSMGVLRNPDEDGSKDVGFFELVGFDFRPLTVTVVYCNQVKSRASITDRLEKARL